MQLQSLYIKEYKLLRDFRIEFNQPLSLFIGKNGSGKSTVLEVIALILRGAYLHFVEQRHVERLNFHFELVYINIYKSTNENIEVQITGNSDQFAKYHWNIKSYKTVGLEKEIIDNIDYEDILPSNVLIYYAGWHKMMENISKTFDENFERNLRGISSFPVSFDSPFMLYLRQKHLPMFLSALYAYEYSTDIDEFFKNKIGINNHNFDIRLFIQKPTWGINNDHDSFWGATGLLKQFLEVLKSNTTSIEANEYYQNISKGIVEMSFGVAEWYKVRDFYNNEKRLFYLLNALDAADLLSGIRVFTQKIGENFKIRHWELSEGEQQLITIKAINELLIEENTLLLFDEPDTYLHPEWQRTFLGDIETIIDSNNAHLIVTSHSPMMIANMKEGELFKMLNGKVQPIKDGYYGKDYGFTLENYMGTSSEVEETHQDLSKLFELIETDKFKEAQILLEELNKKYPNEPELTRAQTMITLLTEED